MLTRIPDSNQLFDFLSILTTGYGDFECYVLKPDLTIDTVSFHSSWDYYR